MNSPYKGKFKVTQQFKNSAHDGLDLVGVDSKEIHSTIDGVVEYASWENSGNKKQGFGLYVRIKANNSTDKYYFGHLSKIKVKAGQTVRCGDVIGIEGNTGKSTGSHCHYCIRENGSRSQIRDVAAISGIPNIIGVYQNNKFTAGWKQDSKGWWYQNSDGSYLKKQWKQDSNGWCYLDSNGYALQNTWKKINGKWYYFDGGCHMVTGLQTIDNKLYYLADDGHLCYTDASGALK